MANALIYKGVTSYSTFSFSKGWVLVLYCVLLCKAKAMVKLKLRLIECHVGSPKKLLVRKSHIHTSISSIRRLRHRTLESFSMYRMLCILCAT